MFEVDTFSRQAIGFDRLFDVMNNIRGTDTNYPPYDIIKKDEETFVIEFAFTRDFVLADTLNVEDVTFSEGILRIVIKQIIPEEQKPKKIKIN